MNRCELHHLKTFTPVNKKERAKYQQCSYITYAWAKADLQYSNASYMYVYVYFGFIWFKVLEEPIPADRYHGIYFAMLLAGVGFLLPYNSFITDVDYLHHKFEGIAFPYSTF